MLYSGGGAFGSEFDSVSFTADLGYAKIFAESWRTARGIQKLREYFGNTIENGLSELSAPILLQCDGTDLGPLQFRRDCGQDEWYLEKGSVDLSKVTVLEYELYHHNL